MKGDGPPRMVHGTSPGQKEASGDGICDPHNKVYANLFRNGFAQDGDPETARPRYLYLAFFVFFFEV